MSSLILGLTIVVWFFIGALAAYVLVTLLRLALAIIDCWLHR